MQWNVIPTFLAILATAITDVAACKTARPSPLHSVSVCRLLTSTVPTQVADDGGGQGNQW